MNDRVKDDKEVKRILENDNYGEVYKLLNSHIKVTYSNDPKVKELTDRVFLKYLNKIKENKKDDYVYEKVLFDSAIFFELRKESMKQILEKDIDLNYCFNPIFKKAKKHPECLANYLANQIRDKELMGILIDKLDSNKFNYYMSNGARTNMFIMNLIAGRLDKSLSLVNSSNFNFIDDNVKEMIANNFSNKNIRINDFNPLRDDYLTRCINELTIVDCKSKDEQIKFLKKVLYSRKVKMFNVDANMLMLSDLLPSDEYYEFINYLKTDAKNGNVVLYGHKFDKHMVPTIYNISSNDFETKYLKRNNKVLVKKV